MNILIVLPAVIPAKNYGGTERVIWYLGRDLVKLGHRVTYLVNKGSVCDFANVVFYDHTMPVNDQIPEGIDLVHLNHPVSEEISKPHVVTMHVNVNDDRDLNRNAIFVSRNHASRFGSDSFVYNGLDWDDYGKPELSGERSYFHFLGKAAWRLKNVKGAIDAIKLTKSEKLRVLGGYRLNIKMGFRLTLSRRVKFFGMVGGEEKKQLLKHSKGLIFPVRWHEPFGLAIIESLYFGCPVFGTPYGSLPELVSNDVGFLTDNAHQLAGALENWEAYSKQRCHEYAVEEFNSKKMAESYLTKYEKVLNGEKLNDTSPKLIEKQTEKFLPFFSR